MTDTEMSYFNIILEVCLSQLAIIVLFSDYSPVTDVDAENQRGLHILTGSAGAAVRRKCRSAVAAVCSRTGTCSRQ
jgi:hypothetical protein